jgi:hypothetical protein
MYDRAGRPPGVNKNIYDAGPPNDLDYGIISVNVPTNVPIDMPSVLRTSFRQCRGELGTAYATGTLTYFDDINAFRKFSPKYVVLLVVEQSVSSSDNAKPNTSHYRATGYVFDVRDVFGKSEDYAAILKKSFVYKLPNDYSLQDPAQVIAKHKENMKP